MRAVINVLRVAVFVAAYLAALHFWPVFLDDPEAGRLPLLGAGALAFAAVFLRRAFLRDVFEVEEEKPVGVGVARSMEVQPWAS